MEKFNNFDEIMETMINPLDNPDFYAMIMTQTRSKFSLAHGYNLGANTTDDWVELWNYAFDEYFKNVQTEDNNSIMHHIREKSKNGEKLSISDLIGRGLGKTLGTSIDIAVPGMRSNWFYYSSKQINPNLSTNHIPSADVKHRLYLTMDAKSRVEMAKRIVEKCTLKGIPYRFKVLYSTYQKQENMQSDTIVMYLAEEQQVVEYVNIINEIFDENPELKADAHKVSPHLGMIGDYIGYGFEPKLDNEKRTSYSGFLEDILTYNPKKDRTLDLKQMALDIFIRLSLDSKSIFKQESPNPELEMRLKPSDRSSSGLESKEEYRRVAKLLYNYMYDKKHPRIETEDSEKIKKYLSNYFRWNGMQCEEIKYIRLYLHSQICKNYPKLLEEKNMYSFVDLLKGFKQKSLQDQIKDVSHEIDNDEPVNGVKKSSGH